MKNIFKLIIATFILLPVISGCSNGAEESSSSGEKTVLTLSVWDDITDETPYIKAFEEQNPDIDIQIVQIPSDDYSQKLLSLQGTNNAPDIMLLMEADYPKYVENEYILPITDQVESSDKMDVTKFIPSISDIMYSEDEQIYGLPWCVATQLLYYNKEMFDKAGVEYPTADWTYDDFESAATKLTSSDGSVYGSDAITDTVVWYSMFGQYNNEKSLLNSESKFDINDGIIGAAKEEAKLTNELKVMPKPTTGSASADIFMSNQAAMTRQGSWYMSIYQDLPFAWDVAPMPAGTNDYSALHTGFFTINSKTKSADAAWKFVEFMLSDDGQELLMQASHNASARTDVAKPDAWKVEGTNGPTNFDAMSQALETAEIGQGFVNRTEYDNLALKVNEYVNGNITEEELLAAVEETNSKI